MRVFQHVELLAGLLLADFQRDRVRSRWYKQRNAAHRWSSPPALRTQRYVGGIGRSGSQFDFRAGLRSQVPPQTVDARLRFARRTATYFFATTSTSTRNTSPSYPPGTFSSWRSALQLAHGFAVCIANRDSGAIFLAQLGLEIEVDRSAVQWIATRGRVIRNTPRVRHGPE